MLTKLPKTLIGAAAAVIALSACSSDDTVINEAKAQKGITFNVTTNRASRANVYYDGKNDVKRFKVSAWANKSADQTGTISGTGRSYFDEEALTLKDNKWSYDDGDIRYWPNNGETLDFYAWVDNKSNPAVAAEGENAAVEANASKGYTFAWTGTLSNRATLQNIPQENAADMVDLLYGNEFGEKQKVNATATSSQVSLNMKHAFAQIGVKVQVVNPKIQVQVEEVALVNLIGKADFEFDAEEVNASTADANKANWKATADAGVFTATAAISPAKTINNNTPVDLTTTSTTTDGETTVTRNTFMVLPCNSYETAAADATKVEVNANGIPSSGTYIGLKCKVWNIQAATGAANNDLLIHGTADTYKYLYVPVALNTEMGKNYTYTISFGKGHAGFNEAGECTLVAIDWDVNDVAAWDSVTPATNEQ